MFSRARPRSGITFWVWARMGVVATTGAPAYILVGREVLAGLYGDGAVAALGCYHDEASLPLCFSGSSGLADEFVDLVFDFRDGEGPAGDAVQSDGVYQKHSPDEQAELAYVVLRDEHFIEPG